jgi:hypothetical protein
VGEPEQNYLLDSLLTTNSNEYVKIIPDDKLYSLMVRMRLKGYLGNEGTFRYKGNNLEKLKFLTFTTKNYSFDFVVENYPYEYLNVVSADIYVCFKGLSAKDLEKLKPGIKERVSGIGQSAEILW